MLITVSLLTYNSRAFVLRCLASLLAQEGVRLEVVVIDNASADGTADLVAREFPHVRLIRNRQNLYFARGHNGILDHVSGDAVLLLNPDVVFPRRDVLKGMADALAADPTVGACTCAQDDPDRGGELDIARRPQTLSSLLGWFTFLGMLFPRLRTSRGIDPGGSDARTSVEMVLGSCVLIRASLFRDLRGFDPAFRLYFTDDELCLRLRRLGYRIVLMRDFRAHHFRSHALKQLPLDVLFRTIHYDMRQFVRRHRPFHVRLLLPMLAFLTWVGWRGLQALLPLPIPRPF
jgi:GT2 family glycosyltransferase